MTGDGQVVNVLAFYLLCLYKSTRLAPELSLQLVLAPERPQLAALATSVHALAFHLVVVEAAFEALAVGQQQQAASLLFVPSELPWITQYLPSYFIQNY